MVEPYLCIYIYMRVLYILKRNLLYNVCKEPYVQEISIAYTYFMRKANIYIYILFIESPLIMEVGEERGNGYLKYGHQLWRR